MRVVFLALLCVLAAVGAVVLANVAFADEVTPDVGCPDVAPAVAGDRQVTAFDLSEVGGHAGQAVPPAPARDDLHADGAITAADISAVAGKMGKQCLPETFDVTIETVEGQTGAGESLGFYHCDVHARHFVVNRYASYVESMWIVDPWCYTSPPFAIQIHCMGEKHLYDLVVEEYGSNETTAPGSTLSCSSGGVEQPHSTEWRGLEYNIGVWWSMWQYTTGQFYVDWHYQPTEKFPIN